MLEISSLKRESVPTGNIKYPARDCLVVYRVSNFRWEETPDPIHQDVEYFCTELEAVEHLNKIPQVAGFTSIAEAMYFDFDDILVEDIENGILNPKDYSPYCVDTTDSLLEHKGKDITGSIIIEWSYEKFVGYARNLKSIGIAGEWPFNNFKTESDLITGNEGCTSELNYSILMTKEEINKSISQDNLDEQIHHKLYSRDWRWNRFKNNPETLSGRIEEIIKFAEDGL